MTLLVYHNLGCGYNAKGFSWRATLSCIPPLVSGHALFILHCSFEFSVKPRAGTTCLEFSC